MLIKQIPSNLIATLSNAATQWVKDNFMTLVTGQPRTQDFSNNRREEPGNEVGDRVILVN